MINLIIFDYDGVIVDSFKNVHEVYRTICDKLGKTCPEKLEDFKKVYGHSSTECYSNLGFSEEERLEGNKIFKEEILKKEAKPFKGIIDVLKELNNDYKLALISSSYKEEVKQKLKKIEVLELFDFVIAKESDVGRFEKTKSIETVINDLDISPDEVLLIGDRNVDFVEGSKAGLKNIILVDYGWGYKLEEIPEYKPKASVKYPKDIPTAVKEF